MSHRDSHREHGVWAGAERPTGTALGRGLRRLCPRCGEAGMFSGYLSVRDTCPSCGLELSHHRADDAPAWLTILITAHLVAPVMLYVLTNYTLPDAIQIVIWPLIIAMLALIVLPFAKGFIIAFQWARRMHGFASET